MSETMTPAEVHEIVQELRTVDYRVVGQAFFDSRFKRLADAGWVLGVEAFSQTLTHGRRGHPLLTPRNEWRNVAYFYNPAQMTKVWYWNNAAFSKAAALDVAARTPAPAGDYHAFTKTAL